MSQPITEQVLEKVYARMVSADKSRNDNDHMDFEIWEWPVGIALYGLYRYYRRSGKTAYLQLLIDWFDKQIANGLPNKDVNSVAPMLTLAHLYEETKNEAYLTLCLEWAEWVMNDMPRTDEGGLQHITAIADNEQQLWDDTLFMTGLFLAKMGAITGNTAYRDEAEYQFLLHIKYLYDAETGLWFHGWHFDGRHRFGRTLWARGNCWFTAGVVEFLEISGAQGALKRYLLETLAAQARALVRLQSESGMWHTLLNDPTSYVEASATAGFAFGLLKAVRQGFLDESFAACANRAAQAVIVCIAEDGTVGQVSYGTAIGYDDAHYKAIPITPTAYGQALTIMMLTELPIK